LAKNRKTNGPIIPVTYINGKRQFATSHKQRIGEKRKGKRHTKETRELMSKKAFARKRG
jgi:hypothetical protein